MSNAAATEAGQMIPYGAMELDQLLDDVARGIPGAREEIHNRVVSADLIAILKESLDAIHETTKEALPNSGRWTEEFFPDAEERSTGDGRGWLVRFYDNGDESNLISFRAFRAYSFGGSVYRKEGRDKIMQNVDHWRQAIQRRDDLHKAWSQIGMDNSLLFLMITNELMELQQKMGTETGFFRDNLAIRIEAFQALASAFGKLEMT